MRKLLIGGRIFSISYNLQYLKFCHRTCSVRHPVQSCCNFHTKMLVLALVEFCLLLQCFSPSSDLFILSRSISSRGSSVHFLFGRDLPGERDEEEQGV